MENVARSNMVPEKRLPCMTSLRSDPVYGIDGESLKARSYWVWIIALRRLADEGATSCCHHDRRSCMDGAFGLQTYWLQADILIISTRRRVKVYIQQWGKYHLPTCRSSPAGFEIQAKCRRSLPGGEIVGHNANKLVEKCAQ